MPTGPLEVSDITKESVKLTWKPPADDGGSEISYDFLLILSELFLLVNIYTNII